MHLDAILLIPNAYPETVSPKVPILCLVTVQVKVLKTPLKSPFCQRD